MIPPVRRGVVRAAIVAIVALVSLGAARTSVMTTSSFITPAGARAWSGSYDQVLCLQSTLHRSVPKGARVYLEPSNVQAGKPNSGLDHRLVGPSEQCRRSQVDRVPFAGTRWLYGSAVTGGQTGMIVHVMTAVALLAVPALMPTIALIGRRPATVFLVPLAGSVIAAVAAELKRARRRGFSSLLVRHTCCSAQRDRGPPPVEGQVPEDG